MIDYNPKTWTRLIFKLTQRDLLKKVAPYILGISVYTTILLWVMFEIFHVKQLQPIKNLSAVYSILGFVLSLLLVFRTNTSYDRWWEGRKVLGALTNTSRTFAIFVASLSIKETDKKHFAKMLNTFVFVLKNRLQGIPDEPQYLETLNLKQQQHVPLRGLVLLSNAVEKLRQENQLTSEQYRTMIVLIKDFSDIIGACERIKNTPIPYSYGSFIKKFIFIYTFSLPFAWMFDFGYYTVLAVAFVFYVLVSIELLAEEIENPFGLDENDLPFDAIAKNIEHNINEILHVLPPH